MKWTDERRKEIEGRCEKATKGPWYFIDSEAHDYAIMHIDDWEEGMSWPETMDRLFIPHESNEEFDEDAHFIANARQDIPDMLAELDRLKAQLGGALAAVDAEPLGKADRWGRDAVYEAKANIKARIKGVMGGGT